MLSILTNKRVPVNKNSFINTLVGSLLFYCYAEIDLFRWQAFFIITCLEFNHAAKICFRIYFQFYDLYKINFVGILVSRYVQFGVMKFFHFTYLFDLSL